MRLKVANAYRSGEQEILWLAGGYAVYRHNGKEEIFECLDEAAERAGWHLEQDPELLKAWACGYDLPADEDLDWPEIFLVKEEQQ
jgi:hypothetical protein